MDKMINITEKNKQSVEKQFDNVSQFNELLDTVNYVYDTTGEIYATAVELGMSTVKVKKLLITSGKLEYDETKQIQRLLAYGKKMSEIQEETGLKKSSINSYLPYTKMPYKESEVSANARRCELYRNRKQAVTDIHDFDSLWKCVELFQKYPFYTIEGLKFEYTVCRGEIFISHTENSITKAGVEKAYKKVAGESLRLYNRPNDLGELYGISYIYPIFYRFGLIDVSEMVNQANYITRSQNKY